MRAPSPLPLVVPLSTFSTSSARCCRLIFIHFSHDNDAYYEFFVISRVLYFFSLPLPFASLLHSSLYILVLSLCISFHIFNISSTLPFPSNRQNNLHAGHDCYSNVISVFSFFLSRLLTSLPLPPFSPSLLMLLVCLTFCMQK